MRGGIRPEPEIRGSDLDPARVESPPLSKSASLRGALLRSKRDVSHEVIEQRIHPTPTHARGAPDAHEAKSLEPHVHARTWPSHAHASTRTARTHATHKSETARHHDEPLRSWGLLDA